MDTAKRRDSSNTPRCLMCGCSRLDERAIGCALCGMALGPRWEECYVSEETKANLLSHSEELARMGVTLEKVSPLRKDAGTTMTAIALALAVADSLKGGVLRSLVIYLHRQLTIPRDEILRLRLTEPEEIDEMLKERGELPK